MFNNRILTDTKTTAVKMLKEAFTKKYLFIVLIIVAILFPVISLADANKIFRENKRAVVVVVTYNGKGKAISQGSGFIVRADGAIVTNYHVISNAKNIKVKIGDKVLEVEGLLHTDKENDLVILKVKGVNLPIVKLGDIQKATIGEAVYVISSPQGLENTISDGILSGIREITPERKVLQITAPISPGSSGGPVFNKNGEVIGIATFLIKEAQNLNFAMPVNLIKNKIGKKVTALKDSGIEDYKKTAEYWFYLGTYYGGLIFNNDDKETGKRMREKAINALEQGIKIKPDEADAYKALGYIYWESGRYSKAIEAFKQAIRFKQDDVLNYVGLGLAYKSLGKYSEAIEAYKQAIRFKPDYAEAYDGLARVYMGMGKDMLKDMKDFASMPEKARKLFAKAVDAFKQAIRLKPDYAEAYEALGLMYWCLQMPKEEMEVYKQMVRLEPYNAEEHYRLGIAYAKLGRYSEAVDAFKQAIRLKPDFAMAHLGLGLAYDDLGMYGEAIEAYKQTISLNPTLLTAHFSLGTDYGKSGMYREAMEAFKQTIRLKPDYAEAHYNLGLVFIRLDRYSEAANAFKQAIRIKPDFAMAHLVLGLVYLQSGDNGAALDEYKILKELDKDMANKLFDMIYK